MHGELGNRFYLLFCDDREKKTNGKHRETERKNETKNARSKNAFVRADATTRLALDRSHLAKNIHSKTRSSRCGEIPGPFPPSLPREMRIILFSQTSQALLPSPPACVPIKSKNVPARRRANFT